MRVLIIGSGGREHAMAWKVRQSPKVTDVFVANGNAGTAREPNTENVSISPTAVDELVQFAKDNEVQLTIVGPEAPLSAGVVDAFEAAGLACFGPTQAAAQLESSKDFCKAFMVRHGIPTAEYASFTDIDAAKAYLNRVPFPLVLKADGLAAGKGVVIADTPEAAIETLDVMMVDKAFGDAGQKVVIESFLEGEEASFIVMSDGDNILPMATSQDHKARDEGDRGPNTGGMGAYSPAPVVTPERHERIMAEVIRPAIEGMKKDGVPFKGFLYAGLMISPDDDLHVLEFNCRFGDPETQPILMRLRSDLVELCEAGVAGTLGDLSVDWDPRFALGVVLASGGYPASYKTDLVIEGLDEPFPEDTYLFHAGTQQVGHQVVTKGGRVLCAVGLGESLRDAQQRAYRLAEQVSWPASFYRRDIGHRALTHHDQ